jgi:type IV pilus assembly protein PilB
VTQRKNLQVYKEFAKIVHVGIQTATSYPADHPVRRQAIREAFQILRTIFHHHRKITLGVSGDRLFADDLPLDLPSFFVNSLTKKFREKSIDGVTFYQTLSLKDLVYFFEAMKPGYSEHQDDIGSTLIRKGISSITFNEMKYGRLATQRGDQGPEVFVFNEPAGKYPEAHAEQVYAPEPAEIPIYSGQLLKELNESNEKTRRKALEGLLNFIASSSGNGALSRDFPEISKSLLGRLSDEEDLGIYVLAGECLHKICTSQNRTVIYLTEDSIGYRLFDRKQISSDELQRALIERKKIGKSLQYVLGSLNLVDEVLILRQLAEQYRGYRTIRIRDIGQIPVDVREIAPKDIMQRHQVLPFLLVGGNLYTAMTNPSDWQVTQEIRETMPVTKVSSVIPHLAAEYYLLDGLKKFYQIESQKDEISDLWGTINRGEEVEWIEDRQNEALDEEFKENSAPVIRRVYWFLEQAIKKNASDIHIEPGEKALVVRLRIDGTMTKLLETDIRYASAISSRIKVMSRLRIDERRLPQDGRFTFRVAGSSRDLRVSIFPGMFGESVVLRLLNTSDVTFGVRNIGLSEQGLNTLLIAMSKAKGMILVTGPTGSGKTTTLYSIMHDLNDGTRNICTCEDPIEYNLPGVNQYQINHKIELDFPRALRTLLRQDPDIIMVGEIRDPETAEIAVKAALTGHLVLSTLHTNTASETITRLLNMKIEPYLLSPCLNLIIAQRLMRKLCPHCKTETSLNDFQRTVLESRGMDIGTHPVFIGQGCEQCNDTGYRGRFAVYELLPMTEKIQALAEDLKSAAEIRRAAREMGFPSLQEEAFEKVLAGLSSIDEWMRVIA